MLKPFFIWHERVLKRVEPETVVGLLTEGNYTKILFKDKTCYQIRSTLSATLKKLPADMFIKIHRARAVSIFHIDNIARDHLVINDHSVPISRQYYKAFIDKLNIIGLNEE